MEVRERELLLCLLSQCNAEIKKPSLPRGERRPNEKHED